MTAVFTVSELAAYLADMLHADETLQDLSVVGEIGHLAQPNSGHVYFTLKEEGAVLQAVMWRNTVRYLGRLPAVGQTVIAHGRLDFYANRGELRLIADDVQVAGGVGELYRRFEQTKARLQAEGLFDPARKRPLPPLPRRIGLVTSPTGAAMHDFLRVLGERWPLADVLVVPSLVQGAQAPASLRAALAALYRREDIDVIVLARGGGSIEDLWAFNDEDLARFIARSPVPVVSAVGHETDFTIADFVADYRAATPTAAAAAVVAADAATYRQQLTQTMARLTDLIRGHVARRRLQLEQTERLLRRLSPRYRLDQQRLYLDDLEGRLARAWQQDGQRRRLLVNGLEQRLLALNPLAVLSRGYAIVRDAEGRVVRSVAQAAPGRRLYVQVTDGRFGVVVSEETQAVWTT
ncbi:MAG: exodeoxyribonuclease VII large subunit [Anaerolineae bacterium]|nr:exodeoxyribonuclease VII large subunit [Caldilineales bacterium]MCX7852394.1 exodeoxyribonuclease VII large subunit [Caldilineales bacterium]MDW8268007.1 exodeoxyribonuclease VII large subunit [Anaerolineae bacterium]